MARGAGHFSPLPCAQVAGREIFSSCTIIDIAGVSLTQFPQVKSLLQMISSEWPPVRPQRDHPLKRPLPSMTVTT